MTRTSVDGPTLHAGRGGGRLIVLAGIVAVFVAATAYRLRSPGYIYCGVEDEVAAIEMADTLREGNAHPRMFFPRVNLYHGSGSITTLLMWPVFYLAGPRWEIVKWWSIAFGALTLLLTFALVSETVDDRAAFLAVSLLAVHPTFVMGTKAGAWQVSYMTALSTGALFLLRRWWTTRGGWFLFFGMCLLGLGLGTRLWFAWFVAALPVAAATLFRDLGRRVRARPWRTSFQAGGGFLLGAAPLIASESNPDTWTWPAILALTSESEEFFAGWARAVLHLEDSLAGGEFFRRFFGSGPQFPNSSFSILFGAAFFGCALGAMRRSHPRIRTVCSFVALLFLAMFVQVALGPRRDETFHLFIFYPLPQVMIALMATLILDALPAPVAIRRLIVGVIVAVLAAGEVRCLAEYYGKLSANGARGYSTDAIYDLADRLAGYEDARIFSPNIYLASNLRLIHPGLRFASVDAYGIYYEPKLASGGVDAVFPGEFRMRERWAKALAAVGSSRMIVVEDSFHHGVEGASVMKMIGDWSKATGRPFRRSGLVIEAGGGVAFAIYEILHSRDAPGSDKRKDVGRS